jgi:hypothetical protein
MACHAVETDSGQRPRLITDEQTRMNELEREVKALLIECHPRG